MKRPIHALLAAVAICPALLLGPNVQASVVLSGTRVIVLESAGETSISMTSKNEVPVLVQAWIDDGDATALPEQVNTPFLVTPPIYRMNPGQQQAIRIVAMDNSKLPRDRESVYYLNVYEIPPRADGKEHEGKNVLQFTIRSRLKVFYRPKGLTGDANGAGPRLAWSVEGTGSGAALKVSNPTPYHVTVSRVDFAGRAAGAPALSPFMVAPYGSHVVANALPAGQSARPTELTYNFVDDFGAEREIRGKVQ